MKDRLDRRRFLQISGQAIGIGVLYTVAGPVEALAGERNEFFQFLAGKNGEAPSAFSFVQLSDPHVGFEGPPNPLGTKAFETAVQKVRSLGAKPDLALFTGDLIHDTEDRDQHVQRIHRFKEIAGGLGIHKVYHVPGEHDAGTDHGGIYRDHFGETHYTFDHRGVHFVALDNVTGDKPEAGAAQVAWLKKDLTRFQKSTPIVLFTHRPLFDLRPDWEWFTSDGDAVMEALAPFSNVTVLYGHIHRDHEHEEGNIHHYGARSLAWAFPDPETAVDKKPVPFDKEHPFQNVGLRQIQETDPVRRPPSVTEVGLQLQDDGINGMQQMLKPIK